MRFQGNAALDTLQPCLATLFGSALHLLQHALTMPVDMHEAAATSNAYVTPRGFTVPLQRRGKHICV